MPTKGLPAQHVEPHEHEDGICYRTDALCRNCDEHEDNHCNECGACGDDHPSFCPEAG